MKRTEIAIIGGGASSLFLACALSDCRNITVFERTDRLGKKLSATGNGQGNITHLRAKDAEYFSVCKTKEGDGLISRILSRYGDDSLTEFFRALGVPLTADERGRVYPSGRQASALTDALRFALEEKGVEVSLRSRVTDLKKTDGGFLLTVEKETGAETVFAETVVLASGGKAAKNFGTDGTAYALAKGFGHTVTPLYPSLVQLKTDVKNIKTLKGIRINGGAVTATVKGRPVRVLGDIIFTDYGISGDAVFRLSAFIADAAEGTKLTLDLLPETTETEIFALLTQKKKAYPKIENTELLFGVVNNQVGRAVMRLSDGDPKRAAALVKAFPLTVTGTLGFDYAQVTKGGIPLSEVGDDLESRLAENLYFAGETLDVDGQCGGYNLQWAYASARTVADAIGNKKKKDGGQV